MGIHPTLEPSAGYVCHTGAASQGTSSSTALPTGNGDPRFDIWRVAPAPASSSAPLRGGNLTASSRRSSYCKICRNVMTDAMVTSKCCFRNCRLRATWRFSFPLICVLSCSVCIRSSSVLCCNVEDELLQISFHHVYTVPM